MPTKKSARKIVRARQGSRPSDADVRAYISSLPTRAEMKPARKKSATRKSLAKKVRQGSKPSDKTFKGASTKALKAELLRRRRR